MEHLTTLPQLILRPSLQTCLRQTQQCLSQTRHESSFRRAKTALRIPPAPSFALNTTESQDHIIYNPPSSALNVYHTPLKFLPKSDPRRRMHLLAQQQQQQQQQQAQQQSIPSGTTTSSGGGSYLSSRLPPPVRPTYEKNYHLSPADVAEIKRLRTEDPRKWTRVRLAEKFGCSQFFISLCASAPEVAREREDELETVKRRWGRVKREAREERGRRKESWGRGE